MKHPTFYVVDTYRRRESANAAAIEKGLNPDEAVFMCEGGMFGFEIRIYDDWQQWQPALYTKQ